MSAIIIVQNFLSEYENTKSPTADAAAAKVSTVVPFLKELSTIYIAMATDAF